MTTDNTIQRFDIWLANLDLKYGTEAGKTRPVVVIQTDAINPTHLSTLICPLTSKNPTNSQLSILRIAIPKTHSCLDKDSTILVDQIRSIDNTRLTQKLGKLPQNIQTTLEKSILCVLGIDVQMFC